LEANCEASFPPIPPLLLLWPPPCPPPELLEDKRPVTTCPASPPMPLPPPPWDPPPLCLLLSELRVLPRNDCNERYVSTGNGRYGWTGQRVIEFGIDRKDAMSTYPKTPITVSPAKTSRAFPIASVFSRMHRLEATVGVPSGLGAVWMDDDLGAIMALVGHTIRMIRPRSRCAAGRCSLSGRFPLRRTRRQLDKIVFLR